MIIHATEQDLPRIIVIYNSTVPTRQSTADNRKVSPESRKAWFQKHTPKERPILVCEMDGKVATWVSLESFYDQLTIIPLRSAFMLLLNTVDKG